MESLSNRDVLVLMSTYNGEKYLEQQLDSILSQRNCTLNILIRDDNSTDSTRDIIKRYEKKCNNISLIYDGKNLGPAKSFLKLIRLAPDCSFYAFSDQDDIWDSDKLSTAIDALANVEKPAFYSSNARLSDSNGSDLNILAHKNNNIYINFETVVCAGQFLGCTMLFNRYLVQIIKASEFPDVVIMHDRYVSSLCALVEGNIVYDNTAHMSYRQHDSNVVGINTGVFSKIRNRLDYIFEKKDVLLCCQAKEWLRLYGEYFGKDEKQFLNLLIQTEHSLMARLRICFSLKIHFVSINMSLTNRFAFLFGNK